MLSKAITHHKEPKPAQSCFPPHTPSCSTLGACRKPWRHRWVIWMSSKLSSDNCQDSTAHLPVLITAPLLTATRLLPASPACWPHNQPRSCSHATEPPSSVPCHQPGCCSSHWERCSGAAPASCAGSSPNEILCSPVGVKTLSSWVLAAHRAKEPLWGLVLESRLQLPWQCEVHSEQSQRNRTVGSILPVNAPDFAMSYLASLIQLKGVFLIQGAFRTYTVLGFSTQ